MKKNSWKKGLAVCAVLAVSLLASSSGTFSDSEDITTFDVEGATYGTFPSSINEGGAIAGRFFAGGAGHGFVRDNDGAITPFDARNAGNAYPTGINADGTITRYYYGTNGAPHVFVRDKHGNITSFDAPGAGSAFNVGTLPSSINEDGEIVGTYVDTQFLNHGIVRSKDGAIRTVDAPGLLTFPMSINDENAITGNYCAAVGPCHGSVRAD